MSGRKAPSAPPSTQGDVPAASADHLFREDYSDSESDAESDVSLTDVQLGLTDGALEPEDVSNPLVSRVGGRPAWLPLRQLPPDSVARCPTCRRPMELLVQIFAPLDGSPYDRTLLVWGCARAGCQRKPTGCLRAVRTLQFNKRWAAKLEKKKAKEEAGAARQRARQESQRQRREQEELRRQVNPFSTAPSKAGKVDGPGTGLGSALFASAPKTTTPASVANPFAPAPIPSPAKTIQDTSNPGTTGRSADADEDDDEVDDDDEDDSELDEEERLAEELAVKASLQQTEADRSASDWAKSWPSYLPAQYLNTIPEPNSSARAAEKRRKLADAASRSAVAAASVDGGTDSAGDAAGLRELEKESYERMMVTGVDEVFERFVARVGCDGRQVVRYELGGEPLPFSAQGEAYKRLWPKSSSSSSSGVGSRSVATANDTASSGYDAGAVPPCAACGSRRKFEVQLMPNLVNVLRPEAIQGGETADVAATAARSGDEETPEQRRRREIEEALGRRLPAPPDADGVIRNGARTGRKGDDDDDDDDGDADDGGSAGRRVATAAKATTTTAADKKTGLGWSTAMVFVCERDCCGEDATTAAAVAPPASGAPTPEAWREEWIEVQWEE